MADWTGVARSNYFRVKDESVFRAWAKLRDLTVSTQKKDDLAEVRFAVCSETGGWPAYDDAQNTGDDDSDGSIDVIRELSTHLADGEIAVTMEAGYERTKYVSGYAEAIDNTGRRVDISLRDIYPAAAKAWGVPIDQITDCAY